MYAQRFLVSILLILEDMLYFLLGRPLLQWLRAVGVALNITYRISMPKVVHGDLLLSLLLQQLLQPVHLLIYFSLFLFFCSHEVIHLLNLQILTYLQLFGIPLVHSLQVLAMALFH